MSVAAIHLKVEDPTPTPQPAKRRKLILKSITQSLCDACFVVDTSVDFSPTPRAALTVGYEEEAAGKHDATATAG